MSAKFTGEAWYAIQVKARCERSIATLLSLKGYQTLLPTFQSKRYWSGRIRSVEQPLFAGYLFCRLDVSKRLPILVTPGVLSMVGRGRTPIPVEPGEIAALEALLASGVPVQPWPYLEVGQRVRLEDPVLRGIEGILLAFKGQHRIVVSVTLLRRSVSLEIDRSRISPVSAPEKVSSPVRRPLVEGAVAWGS